MHDFCSRSSLSDVSKKAWASFVNVELQYYQNALKKIIHRSENNSMRPLRFQIDAFRSRCYPRIEDVVLNIEIAWYSNDTVIFSTFLSPEKYILLLSKLLHTLRTVGFIEAVVYQNTTNYDRMVFSFFPDLICSQSNIHFIMIWLRELFLHFYPHEKEWTNTTTSNGEWKTKTKAQDQSKSKWAFTTRRDIELAKIFHQ